jgi:hypothetical protein
MPTHSILFYMMYVRERWVSSHGAAQQTLRVDRPPSPHSYASPSSLPATQGQRSKDQISQTAQLELQACLWLIWSSDPGCVSYRTCGYRTCKPPLYLAERRQGALHCNGFRVSSPMLQSGLRKRMGALGVVLGTSQYIVSSTLRNSDDG